MYCPNCMNEIKSLSELVGEDLECPECKEGVKYAIIEWLMDQESNLLYDAMPGLIGNYQRSKWGM